MKARLAGAIAIALLLVLVFAVVAQASTTSEIIKDAQDGTVDGNWTAAQVQAALDFIADNPTMEQYSDVEGVLSDFLASLQAPGSESGELAFTGGEVVLILGAGLGLIGSGVALRRRKA